MEMVHLADEGSTAGLNGFDLSSGEGSATEAGRELGDVKGNAVGSTNRAEAGARGTTDAALSANGLLEGTMLLGVVAVGAERGVSGGSRAISVVSEALRERAGGRGGVRLGRVIDIGCWRSVLAGYKAMLTGVRLLAEQDSREEASDVPGMERGPMNLMRGVRSAWTAAWRRDRVTENMAADLVVILVVIR